MIFFLTSPVQKSTGREKCVSAHFLRVILSQDFVCNAMQTYFSETPNVTPTDQGRSPSSRKISVDFPPQTALHCHPGRLEWHELVSDLETSRGLEIVHTSRW